MRFWHTNSERRRGETLLLVSAVFHGLFPVFLHAGTEIFPAVFFAGASLIVGSLFPFVLLLLQGRLRISLDASTFKQLLIVCLFNLILPTFFFALGTRLTTGINTALLLQAEMLFTFLIVNLALGERMRSRRLFGAATVFVGTVLVLFHGTFTLNLGDLLIVLGTFFYPFGNITSKKLVGKLGTLEILALRSLLSGVALLIIAFLFGEDILYGLRIASSYAGLLILVQGFSVLFIAKVLWYEGLRAIAVGKAVFLVASAPAFGVLFATLILKETPTPFQLVGLVVTLVGVYYLTSKPSAEPIP